MTFKFTPMAVVLAGIVFSMQVSAAPDAAPAATAATPAPAAATAPATTPATTPTAPAAATTPATTPAPTPTTPAAATPAVATPAATQTATPAAAPAADAPVFTSEQEKRIGEVAKEYLLAHPEVLIEVSQKLQAQQQEQRIKTLTAAALAHQDDLLLDKMTPAYGPADAKVAVIEFFDYQCSVCAQQAPILKALMNEKPDVRFIFKEWPIFANRWESSMNAAETGLQIWQQKGADAYLAYHNAIFETGHNEGKLTPADIKKAAAKAGKLVGKKEATLDTLSKTDALAQNLGLRGTPGLIIMPVSGATLDNITVIPGGTSLESLEAAIVKAGGN